MKSPSHYPYRTLAQNVRLHTLIGLLHIDTDHKRELVEMASEGRVSSSAYLSINECSALIKHLQEICDRKDQAAVKMRRKIMSLCYELGWTTKLGKVDYNHLNAWMLKFSYLHKPLMSYNSKELPKLVTQLETIINKSLK